MPLTLPASWRMRTLLTGDRCDRDAPATPTPSPPLLQAFSNVNKGVDIYNNSNAQVRQRQGACSIVGLEGLVNQRAQMCSCRRRCYAPGEEAAGSVRQCGTCACIAIDNLAPAAGPPPSSVLGVHPAGLRRVGLHRCAPAAMPVCAVHGQRHNIAAVDACMCTVRGLPYCR